MSNALHILISLVPGLTLRERLHLAEHFSEAEELSALNSRDISVIIGRKMRTRPFTVRTMLPEVKRILAYLNGGAAEALWFWDPGYPPQLREIYDPPCLLYVRGSSFTHDVPHIAVVGTRHPSSGGTRSAFLFGASCAREGFPVVSGLALGIDTAVHSGTVRNNGRTIAVLGNGIDSVYPPANKRLAGEIVDRGGTIVSEFPPGTPPLRYNFPKRNRIISGLSSAVVVIEAPEGSGALITADYALDQGRSLFVHSCCLQSGKGYGSCGLAFDGAGIVDSAEDLQCFFSRKQGEPRIMLLDNPEGWDLSELLEAELDGKLIQYEGTYYTWGGTSS